MFIVIPPFSRWVLIFFTSPPARVFSTSAREWNDPGWFGRYDTPAGKYELLNLDKGSRLDRCTRSTEWSAIRQPNAAGLPVIKRNHGDCLFTPPGTSESSVQRATTMGLVCKNRKHRVEADEAQEEFRPRL